MLGLFMIGLIRSTTGNNTAIFSLITQLYLRKITKYFYGYQIKNTAMISFLTAFAFVIISFISPILAGIADFLGNKKRFIQFCLSRFFSCIGLFWFNLDNIYTGLFLYFLALIGFWASLIFYNLPSRCSLSRPTRQSKC